MNMGGMSLSTLDLVAARVAKVSQEPLYDRILQHLSENKKYNMNAIPNEIKRIIPKGYNASREIKAVDVRVLKNCSDFFWNYWGFIVIISHMSQVMRNVPTQNRRRY